MQRRKKERTEVSGTLQNEGVEFSGSLPKPNERRRHRTQSKSNPIHAVLAVIVGAVICTLSWLQYRSKIDGVRGNRLFSKWDGRKVDLMPSILEYMRVSKLESNFSAFQRVYVVKSDGLYVADLIPNNQDNRMVAERANMTEGLLTKMVPQLPNDAVFLVNYRDSRFCLDETLFTIDEAPIRMLPILTLSRPVTCHYTFPMPSYETIRFATKRVTENNDPLEDPPPWSLRDKRVVWRGSPTGKVRIELATFARNHADLLDYQLTFFLVTGKKGNSFMGPNDLQKYRAILDVDGASWSSRFGSLLCSRSVILKYDPRHVDYFQDELKPFVHYVPVSNTSDLLEKAKFVADDNNEEFIEAIIRNANHWCEHRLRPTEVEKDMSSVLNEYSRNTENINTGQLMSTFSFSQVLSG